MSKTRTLSFRCGACCIFGFTKNKIKTKLKMKKKKKKSIYIHIEIIYTQTSAIIRDRSSELQGPPMVPVVFFPQVNSMTVHRSFTLSHTHTHLQVVLK